MSLSPTQSPHMGTFDVPVTGPSQGPACTSEARKVGGRSLDRAATPQAQNQRRQESEARPDPLPSGERERSRPRVFLPKLKRNFV